MCLAVPVQIMALTHGETARVSFGGVERSISLAMTPDAHLGDYVLVHAGYAISILEPEEAAETLALLAQLDDAGDEITTATDE